MKPAVATMYVVRDALIDALPFYPMCEGVRGEPDKLSLSLLHGARTREVSVTAELEGKTVTLVAAIAPYGHKVRASAHDAEQAARDLAASIETFLLRPARAVSVVFRKGRR